MRRSSLDAQARKSSRFEREYTLKERAFSWFWDLSFVPNRSSSSFFPKQDALNFSENISTDT